MKKTVSLRLNTQFKTLYYRGKVYHSKLLVMHILPNRQIFNQLGLTVGKKIGKAVKRNRVRRLIYESYRSFEPVIKCGYNIVFVARPCAYGESFESIRKNVECLLKNAKLV